MESSEARTGIRIAAVGDLHCTAASRGTLRPWLQRLHAEADVLLLCGDLTDAGRRDQAHLLADELSVARVPILAVLGNHDYFAGEPETVIAVLRDAGVRLLGGDTLELAGVGFVGTKGFVGGFGEHAMRPGGDPSLTQLMQETLDEAERLEQGLARLQTPQRVVVLHYAPIRATIAREPVETHAFFGSSLLEEPLLRHPVHAVFHGHAHRGPREGQTASGTPVYNVAAPLLRASSPERCPYRIVTLP